MFQRHGRLWRARLRGTRPAGIWQRTAAIGGATIALLLGLSVAGASAGEWQPIARWPMDETSGTTMVDAVGDHDGTTSDVELGLSGHTGHAYGFDGESSYAVVSSADTLNPGDRDVRVSVWLKTTDQLHQPDWDLLKKGYYGDSPGLYKVEYQPSGQASCGFGGTNDYAEVTGGPDLADGHWHQVSCTKTARSIALTVDGHTARTKKAKIGEIANTDRLMIGSYRGAGSGGHLLGSLDEVTIETADGSRRNPSED